MTGLVLEGGALRGIFTAGFLDVLMENKIYAPYIIGVSAGGSNAMSYKSRQIGRNKAVTHPPKRDSYYGLGQFIKCGHIVNLDKMLGEFVYERFPFDFDTYFSNDMRVEYVATCLETGESEFLTEESDPEKLLKIVKATCALPMLSDPVEIDGKHYADGSITDSIPARRAIENGCERVVAVLTRPDGKGHATDYTKTRGILKTMFAKEYPKFFEACMNRMEYYIDSVHYLEKLKEEGRALIIRPGLPELSKMEKDEEIIEAYYQNGRDKATENIAELREWLL